MVKPQLYVVLFGVTATACLASFIAYLVGQHTDDLTPVLSPLTTAASVMIAAIGLSVGAYLTLRNLVRQHTVTMLFTSRFSTTPWRDARDILMANYPPPAEHTVTREQYTALASNAADDKAQKLASALIYMVNYYEITAAALFRGDLEEKLLRQTIRGNFYWLYDLVQPWILAEQNIDRRRLEHMVRLYRRWKRQDDREDRRDTLRLWIFGRWPHKPAS